MSARDEAEKGWVSGRLRESVDGLGGRRLSPEDRAQANADKIREVQQQDKAEQIGKHPKRGRGGF